MKMTSALLAAFAATLVIGTVQAQVAERPIPRLVQKDGRFALFVDDAPFLILGVENQDLGLESTWPAHPKEWAAMEYLHANTIEIPIYWDQIEEKPGQFNFSSIDRLLAEARQHNVRLILLWFATWKNGSDHYLPQWVKLDPTKHPNIVGRNGQPVDSPSPINPAGMELDAKAFAAVMAHLKDADPQHTLLMVQVENETGAWGSVRDYSPTAQKVFEGPVPAELLTPTVLKQLNRPVDAKGTWTEVFGADADEYFQAYSVAHYVGQVAAAGKAVNPLPMYVNAALRDPITNPKASTYESGGPTDNVIPIWKAAAPALDLVAPDIYISDSTKAVKVMDLYTRPDNALMIPEIGSSAEYTRYIYADLAHGGIGFSPFGIDDNGRGAGAEADAARLAPLAQEYAVLGPMDRELAQWAFDGKIKAIVEKEDHANQTLDLGSWQMTASFGGAGGRGGRAGATANPAGAAATPATGRLLVATLGDSEFVLLGTNCRITVAPAGPNKGKAWHFLKVEEGHYDNGTFNLLRIRNGDETDGQGVRFDAGMTAVLHMTLYTR